MRKYSIVVPTYPPDFYLLSSLIGQINRFTVDENKYTISEIIFAASEVSSLEAKIMEEELNKISKYKVIVNGSDKKCNASTNRNRGWNSVYGDWIVFLDCDDIYHMDKIKVAEEAIEKYKDTDPYLFLHSYFFNYEHTEINEFNFGKRLSIDDDLIALNDDIFRSTFPERKWIEIPFAYNGNTNVHSTIVKKFAHGISTVNAKCKVRFPEDFKDGEDGLFCRKVCFEHGGAMISEIPLMIYNLTRK